MASHKFALLISALTFSTSIGAIEVPLVREGGVYTVPVRINDVLTLDFIIDSGAAEVQVPADVALTLLRTKTISQDDFLPGETYRLADGSKTKSSRFNIKELRIGDYVVNQVSAGISDIEGPLLLGQSFLSSVWKKTIFRLDLSGKTACYNGLRSLKKPPIPPPPALHPVLGVDKPCRFKLLD